MTGGIGDDRCGGDQAATSRHAERNGGTGLGVAICVRNEGSDWRQDRARRQGLSTAAHQGEGGRRARHDVEHWRGDRGQRAGRRLNRVTGAGLGDVE